MLQSLVVAIAISGVLANSAAADPAPSLPPSIVHPFDAARSSVLIQANPGSSSPDQIVDPFEVAIGPRQGPVQRPVDPFEVSFNLEQLTTSRLENAPSVPERVESSCSIDFEMPFPVRRALVFYLLSDDAKRCSRAVREIRSLSAQFGGDVERSLELPSFIGDGKNELSRGIVERYVNSCNYKLSEDTVSRLLDLEHRLQIGRTLGTFTTKYGSCVGTITGDTLLTAKHCFGREKNGQIEVDIPDNGFTFTSFDKSIQLQVLKPQIAVAPLKMDELSHDWIQLPFKVLGGTPSTIPLNPDLAARWQPLLLISVSRYLQALKNDLTANPDTITVDISPPCSIQARDGGFLFHSCQTLRGMSGSPLLTMHEGRLITIGIHTGDSDAIQTDCGRKLSAKYKNYGVLPGASGGGTRD